MSEASVAGRVCPPSYRYNPSTFRRPPDGQANTIFVVGGLYGNLEALHALERLLDREAGAHGNPMVVFNGDFHWFDLDPRRFLAVHEAVMRMGTVVLRGNVETELQSVSSSAGCGCAYPADVSDAVVNCSNQILGNLKNTAMQVLSDGISDLASLPMHHVAQVADRRVGIVHGDAESLAGWSFSQSNLDSPEERTHLCEMLDAASVDVFASSHTCTPVVRKVQRATEMTIVANNGAAGMPNFLFTQFGVITRISATPCPPSLQTSLIHRTVLPRANGGCELYIEAHRLNYDALAFLSAFLRDWPPGSAAHQAYHTRLTQGPSNSRFLAYGSV